MIALLALLLGLPLSQGPAPAVMTEISRSYNVFDAAGEIAMGVDESRLDKTLNITFKTVNGVFVIHQTSWLTTHSDDDQISVTITSEKGSKMEFLSGSFESYLKELEASTENAVESGGFRARDQVLDLADRQDAVLTDGKTSRKELAAFRETVPDDLRAFCELYVRTIDLIGGEAMPIETQMARLGAPRGTKTDAADQGWYVRNAPRDEPTDRTR